MKSVRNILMSISLLALFVTYQVSITMFSHVHYVNGVMIVHSHASSDSEHNHTETQVITIAQAASFVGLEPVQTSVEPVYYPNVTYLEFDRNVSFISDLHTLHIRLRAPPVAA